MINVDAAVQPAGAAAADTLLLLLCCCCAAASFMAELPIPTEASLSYAHMLPVSLSGARQKALPGSLLSAGGNYY